MAVIREVTDADMRARAKRRKELQQRKKALLDSSNKQVAEAPKAKSRARKKAVTDKILCGSSLAAHSKKG